MNKNKSFAHLVKRHNDFFKYTIFGFLASLVNIICFTVLHNVFHQTVLLSNTTAWFLANLFSFASNKHIVFASDNKNTFKRNSMEFVGFFALRLVSLIPDNFIMYYGVNVLHLHNFILKIIDQVIIGIFNYLTTRFIFRFENQKIRDRIIANRKKND